ncbi:16S rRNA (guanine(527)-N(7))-methyltransferase RsmG [soil metagenome]
MKQGRTGGSAIVGVPPRAASEIFGERLSLAQKYAELLATTGIEHGLLGPHEAPKIWDRHIVNCAIVESLLPHRTRVIDIGSGAGLPGLVLAIARPDLRVTLVEPLARRTAWLEVAVQEIGLSNVTVQRARAEAMVGLIQGQVVTARAVARLDKLAAWAWPLLPDGGRLFALKVRSAEQELAETLPQITAQGLAHAEVHSLGADLLSEPVRVIEMVRSARPSPSRAASDTPRKKRRRR